MMNRYFGAVLLALAALALPTQTLAGLMTIEQAERLRQEQREAEARRRAEELAPLYDAIDLYYRAAAELAPGFVEPLIDYATVDQPPVSCDPRRAPKTFAVLVGSGRKLGMNISELAGPANDVDLLATLLPQLGVDAANVHVVLNEDATRDGVRAALMEVLSSVECDDRVVLHFSTRSLRGWEYMTGMVLPGGPYREAWQTLKDEGFSHDQIVEAIAAERPVFDAALGRFVESVFGGRFSEVALMLDDERPEFHEIMLGHDISEYMTAVRNRGAHAIASLDILYAAAADIQARQHAAGESSAWSFEFSREEQQDEARAGNVLLPGHGDFAVFYAGGAAEMTPELRLPRDDPDARVFGLFSFHFANALLSDPFSTPRSVAESIRKAYLAENPLGAHPRIDTSNPDLVLVAEAVSAQSGESPIRILSPTPKRGAMAVERQEITVEGIVEWPSRVLGVHVGTQPANLDASGRFSATVPLNNGMNMVNVVAVTADSRMHRQTLEFVYEGDRKALEGEGRRYAVIVANQNYGGTTGFASLATPFADADALAALLSSKYGFETELRVGATTVPLVLRDPTKRDIQLALHHVGRAVGDKDTVLVYYAGHGIFEPVTSTAYWVPADAEAGFEPSYLSAADISAAVQRMQAGNVMLISDSCYSGALIRGEGQAETVDADERLQSLLRLQARRSRVIITSGNNEPVEDLGGRGHSVFARALLTGLEQMEHDAFSARELFDGYILHAVTANADQEPQYRPLEKVGHEGGDFVFVKMPAATAAAE